MARYAAAVLTLKSSAGSRTETGLRRYGRSRDTLTEQYCYGLIQGQPVTVRAKHTGSLQADVTLRVEAFHRWMQKFNPTYVDSQTFVWSAMDRIAWQRDLRVILDGRLTLIDIKCTAQRAKDWGIQIGCGLSYDTDGCERGAILHLNPDLNKNGFRFIEYDPIQVKGWWRRVVARWHSNRDFEDLRTELGFNDDGGF
jgi:hypothetical protein